MTSETPSPSRIIGPYVIERTIGRGTTGKVKLAHHESTHSPVAIKVISRSMFVNNPKIEQQIHREIALMRIVRHPNIVRLLDVLESPSRLYVILEYADHGTLFNILEGGYIVEDLAMDYFRQIVFGVEYLHVHGICHRDLKAENILLNQHNRVKIADFGFARWLQTDVTRTPCGSPHYTAPEILSGGKYDGRKADLWSLGVILFALLTGQLPFNDPDLKSLLQKIRRGVFVMPPFPPDLIEIIQMLLTVNPNNRATIEDIKSHSTFRIGLPISNYILPSPIPFILCSTPVDVSDLSEPILNILRQIGYGTDEELKTDLESPSHTMAKVFISLLTTQLNLEQLPWNSAFGTSPNSLIDNSFSIDTPVDEASPLSVPRRSEWYLPSTPTLAVIEKATISTDSIYQAMTAVERTIELSEMQFFHPNPMEIYFRRADGEMYGIAKVDFMETDKVELILELHKGLPEMLISFQQSVMYALSEEART